MTELLAFARLSRDEVPGCDEQCRSLNKFRLQCFGQSAKDFVWNPGLDDIVGGTIFLFALSADELPKASRSDQETVATAIIDLGWLSDVPFPTEVHVFSFPMICGSNPGMDRFYLLGYAKAMRITSTLGHPRR